MSNQYSLTAVDFDPFGDKEIEKIAATNEPQREIWLSCVFGGKEANLSYNESVSLKLEGPFVQSAFEDAVKDLVLRHEALRSVISSNGESLIIYKNFSTELFFEDISSFDEKEQKDRLDIFIKKEMNLPFDLHEGPLFRFHLHKLGETACYFTLVVHHIIGDGWSIAVLLQDISKLYSAHAKKEITFLPPPPQISGYALQEAAYTQSQEYIQTEEYWINQYKNSQPVLDVPTDQPRPNPRTYKSHRDDFVLEKELVTAVKKMGAKAGCSLVTTLLSAFEVLLHRTTGQEDIVVGVPAAGQSATDNYGLVGHCVYLLPLRSNPKGQTLFIDYLKNRKKGILDAYDHQRFTFGSLLKKINFKRDSSRITLVPVLFNIDMGLTDGVNFHDLSFKLISNPREFENFEIFVNATGNEQALILEWSYNSYLFTPNTIQKLMDQYKSLLHEVIKNPEQKLEDISLNNSSKKINDWNNTFLAYPKETPLHSLINQAADRFPEKVALKFLDQQYTYKRLVETSNQLAKLLIAEGVKKGDTIGLALDRSPEMVISLLAILRSGAAYIPLDPDFPRKRIEFMLNDSKAKILLTSKEYQGNFQCDAREILIEKAWEELPGFSTEDPQIEVGGDDLAYILYTSGSTGKPKGVMVEHHSLVNLLCSMQKMPGIDVNDRFLAVTTISFDIAGLEIYLPFITGAQLVLTDSQTIGGGLALLDTIKRENITIIQATPSTYKMMLDAKWEEKLPLKILCGGEALPRDLANKLVPKCSALYNMYGPTETTIWSTCAQIFSGDEIITIGHPIHNTQVYILDESQNLLPEGDAGEIYIGGHGVARGYLNRSELTAQKFISNPFNHPGSKMYRTGDVGKFLSDGKIQYLGRIDQQIKIRGNRIEPGEIEHCLNQQRGIKEAIVIAREDRPDDHRLVAYIVPADNEISVTNGMAIQNDEQVKLWKSAIKNLLPVYMLPNDFVILKQFPLTENKKIDRNALPKPEHHQKDNQHPSSRTKTETFLTTTWMEFLDVGHVGVNEDFFELGGHSLIAIKIIFEIERVLGQRISIASFFENPTIEKLAQIIDKSLSLASPACDDSTNPVTEKSKPDQEPEEIWMSVLESQMEMLLTCKFGGEEVNKSYNLPFSQKLTGRFDYEAMKKALQSIVDRHESLRITFNEEGTKMCIHKNRTLEVQYEDVSALQPEEKAFFLDQQAVQNAETSFNLTTGPLIRTSLTKLDDTEHYLTLTVHHIICDGLSIGIIMEELGVLYSAYTKGEYPKLPEAPKFSDYAKKIQVLYKSSDHEKTKNYWYDKFKNDIPVMNLPTDFVRPTNRTFASREINHNVNPELFAQFIKVTSRAGSSAVISIRTILEILIYRFTGNPDILIGLPVAGQFADPQIDRLVGDCPNMLPLRSYVDGRDSYLDYLGKRKSAILEAFDYQQFTIGNLLRQLNVTRDNSHIPFLPVISNINLNQDNPVSFYGLSNELVFHQTASDFFELTLNIGGSMKSPVLNWSYNTDLFKMETIQRLINDFEHLLSEVAHNPEIKIKDIPITDSSFLTRLKEWNNTIAEYPKDKSLVALIHETALRYPSETAIEFYEQRVSYKELNEKSNQFAALLVQQGIIKGQTIGLVTDRSPQMLIALLAIMKSGAAYVPLDPEYPRERIEYMLEDSNAKILIASKRYSRHFKTSAREIILEDSLSKLSKFSKALPPANVTGSDLLYILYTSGSTGKPKGVQIEHHNFVNFLLSMQKQPGIKDNDRVLAITTISFDPAGLELYLPLITGAKIILADTETARDGYKLLKLIHEKNVTLVQATPATWRMLFDSGWDKAYGFKALCGGEPLTEDMAAKLLSLCSSLWNVYGPTETTVWSIIKQITSLKEPITIGRPIDNMQAYILDEYFHNVPPGTMGEIFIAGEGMGRGYCNKPDLTAELFISNPFEKDANKKMYRTGDIGKFLGNGEIQCLGRRDNQVKIRGHRIELGEIENNILKLQDIKEAVVLAREDDPGNKRLVAYVIPSSSYTINKNQDDIAEEKEKKLNWNESLKKVLPPYMIPSDWVILSKFPLSPNNKIDRKALPKPVLQVNGFSKKNDRFPTTHNQKLIAKIWEDELRCQTVSLDDDFFELGGHSLIAVRMMTRLEKETGKRIPLTALFESPTVEKLASVIELDKKDIKWDSLVPIKTNGNKTPIYLIHGGGLSVLLFNSLAKNLHPEQPLYGLQAKGLDGVDENFASMESIVSHYIEEILEQNPEGPYALGGYSFGGLIAFEMGKQLKAMGKKVTLLALFDSYAEESIYHKPLLTKIALKTYEIFMRIVFAFAFMTKEPKIVITNKIRFAKILLKPILEKASLKKEADPESFVAYSKKSAKMYEMAYRNYKLTPYDGSVDLFRAKKQTAYLPDFKYMGWKPLAKKGVVIHQVPGHHLDMFKSPNVEELARQLQAALDKSNN